MRRHPTGMIGGALRHFVVVDPFVPTSRTRFFQDAVCITSGTRPGNIVRVFMMDIYAKVSKVINPQKYYRSIYVFTLS